MQIDCKPSARSTSWGKTWRSAMWPMGYARLADWHRAI